MTTSLQQDFEVFERAAAVFSTTIHAHERTKAEEVLQAFNVRPQPYDFCRFVLEHGKNPYAMSLAAGMLRSALIREWRVMPDQIKAALSSYIITYVSQRPQMETALRGQLLGSFAIIQKRAWMEQMSSQFKQEFFNTTQQMLSSQREQNMNAVITALHLLFSMVNEFSSMKKSEIGLSLEFHERARVAFQKEALPYAFNVGLTMTQNAGKMLLQGGKDKDNAIALLKPSLKLLLEILIWDYSAFDERTTFKRSIPTSKTGESIPTLLEPLDEQWKKMLANTQIFEMLASLHNAIKTDSILSHLVRQCIIQMASLSQRAFPDDKSKVLYLSQLLNTLFSLTQDSITRKSDRELYDWCDTFLRIANTFRFESLMQLSNLEQVMIQLSQITVTIIERSSEDTFNEWLINSLDSLMDAWVSLVSSFTVLHRSTSNTNSQMKQAINNCCFSIFKCFVDTRTSKKNGPTGDDSDDEDGYDEEEYLLDEQLTSLSTLAREDARQSMSLLNDILMHRLSMLEVYVHDHSGGFNEKYFHVLCDDFEWILQFVGYLIADDPSGESPVIPDMINHHAVEHASKDNVFIMLVNNVFKFAQYETMCIKQQRQSILSPRLGETLIWFLQRWAKTYLQPDMTRYKQQTVAPLFMAMYSDTDEGRKVVEFLLTKILNNIFGWQGEPDLARVSCQFFKSLVSNERIRRVLVTTQEWKQLLSMEKDTFNSLNRQNNEVKGALIECLCEGAVGVQSMELIQQQLVMLLTPLKDQFFSVINRADLNKVYAHPAIMDQMSYCIEKFAGVARSAVDKSVSLIYLFFTEFNILQHMVTVIHKYHNYENIVNAVLGLFADTVKAMNPHLNTSQCRHLYGVCLEMIKAFQKYNLDNVVRSTHTDEEEEEALRDLLILLQLLTALVSKEFLDFGENDETGGEIRLHNGELNVSDAVFQGLNLVLPLITLEMLKFRELCMQYFTLMSFMVEIYPENVAKLDVSLFQQLAASISFGMKHHEDEIKRLSIEALHAIADFHVTSISKKSPGFTQMCQQIPTLVEGFIKEILELSLLDTFDKSLVEKIGTTLFALILWEEAPFNSIAESIIRREHDATSQQRLMEAFSQLRNNVTSVFDRRNRIQFAGNFEIFLASSRAVVRKI